VRRVALLTALLPLLLAGCGGSSKDATTQVATTPGPPPTKSAYVELADAICRNHQSRREDLESQAGEVGPLTSMEKARRVAALLRKESDNRKGEVAELRALQPSPGDRPTVNEILSLVEAETRVIDRWAAAYDAGNATAIGRLQIRLGVTAGRATRQARAFGFEVCGQQ
jgi:hypothetical protein